ncbi:MAG: hypothetical protein AAGG48_25950 [Planctomycetota bacterium]
MKIGSFQLSTLFFVITISVLLIATIVAWREAAESRTKYERIAADFGYIEGDHSSKTRIYRFVNRDYRILAANQSSAAESFRLRPAKGSRYVLHVSEFATPESTRTQDLVPSQTVDLKGFRSNAVICCEVVRFDGPTPRVVITVDSETVLDYRSPSSWGKTTETGERWPEVPMAGYQELNSDERIRFYLWEAPQAKRGFVFWLEPREAWVDRLKESGSEKNEGAEANEIDTSVSDA